jgi:type IV secretion system protein VirB2
MLIFGGELNDFARRLVYVVLVAGILLGATTIVGLFGATGASIGITTVADATDVPPARSLERGEGANG